MAYPETAEGRRAIIRELVCWLREWLNPEWITGIGTLLLAVVALFGERIKDFLFRPSLELLPVTTAGPDAALMPMTGGTIMILQGSSATPTQVGPVVNGMYYRLRVKNQNRTAARNAEVSVEKVERRRGDTWEDVSAFLPLNLRWTHRQDIYLPRISKWITKYLDLGHITQPVNREVVREAESLGRPLPAHEIAFAIEVSPTPSNNSHLLPPGEYRLTLLLAAENAKAKTKRIVLNLRDQWNDDPSRMVELRGHA